MSNSGRTLHISRAYLNNKIAPSLPAGDLVRLGLVRREKFGPRKRLKRTRIPYSAVREGPTGKERPEKRRRERGGPRRRRATTATKYCVRAENTALGTRVSGGPRDSV